MQLQILLSDDIFERWHDILLAEHMVALGASVSFQYNSSVDHIVLRRAKNNTRCSNEVVFSSGDELSDVDVGWTAPILRKSEYSDILKTDYLFAGYWEEAEIPHYSAMTDKRFCIYTTMNYRSVNNFFGTLPECFNILISAIRSSGSVLNTSHPMVKSIANIYGVPIVGDLVKEEEDWNNTMFDTARRLLRATKHNTASLYADMCDYEKEVCHEAWSNS